MSLNKKYRTDETLEKEGVVVEFTENGEVFAWIKCRRPGGRNSLFHRVRAQKERENRQALAADEDGTLEHRLLVETYAEAVIVDWGGNIEGPNGEIPAACTKENIVWLFTEDAFDAFRELQARLISRTNWQAKEEEAKNSDAVSATKSSGGSRRKS